MTNTTHSEHTIRLARAALALNKAPLVRRNPPDDAEIRRWVAGSLPRKRVDELCMQALELPDLMQRWRNLQAEADNQRELTTKSWRTVRFALEFLNKAFDRLKINGSLSSRPLVGGLAIAAITIVLVVSFNDSVQGPLQNTWDESSTHKSGPGDLLDAADRPEQLAPLADLDDVIGRMGTVKHRTMESTRDGSIICNSANLDCGSRRVTQDEIEQRRAEVGHKCRSYIASEGVIGAELQQAFSELDTQTEAYEDSAPLQSSRDGASTKARCTALADQIGRDRRVLNRSDF